MFTFLTILGGIVLFLLILAGTMGDELINGRRHKYYDE